MSRTQACSMDRPGDGEPCNVEPAPGRPNVGLLSAANGTPMPSSTDHQAAPRASLQLCINQVSVSVAHVELFAAEWSVQTNYRHPPAACAVVSRVAQPSGVNSRRDS